MFSVLLPMSKSQNVSSFVSETHVVLHIVHRKVGGGGGYFSISA